MAHSMAMAWVVGYGVVTAPGVVAFCANAVSDHKLHNAPATQQARRIMGEIVAGKGGVLPYYLHLPLEHLPLPAHSESKLHLPSGAFEHLPLLHLAPLPPQSESKLHELPAAVAHLPLWHFTPAPQSESKLHLPSAATAVAANATERTSAKRACLSMRTSWG